MARKSSRRFFNLIRLLLLVSFSFGLAAKAALAQNAYDRGTPAESKGGQSSLSTYAQDKIETVNLANMNLNLHIPLATVGGRGAAAYTVALSYNSKLWAAQHVPETITDPFGGTQTLHHYGATYDYGAMTKPNAIPLGSGWAVSKGPAIKVTGIGIDPLTTCGWAEGTAFKYALTKVWLVLPDGSEVEMRDALTEGAPYQIQNPCNGTVDRNRGRVWHSTDGSAITYVSDVDNGVGVGVADYSGWVFLADGTRFKIASGGRCKKIIDPNGNILVLTYDDTTTPGGVTYTDDLGRQVIVQPTFDQTSGLIGATVTVKGYGTVADRTIYVDAGTVLANLRADQQTTFHAIYNSDVDKDGVHADQLPHLDMFDGSDSYVEMTDIGGASAVARLRLLDGRQFQFRYNRFGELAEIVYPGDGVSQIDYVAYGSSVAEGAPYTLTSLLNRGVSARRALSDGSTVDASWSYTRGSANGFPTVAVEVHQGQGGPLLMSETHHFLALDAEYRTTSLSGGAVVSNGTCYEKFDNAREFQVDRQTGSGTQVEAKTWKQRADVVWSFDPTYASEHGQENPPNDPRVTIEDTTLENGQLKRVRNDYDDFNNVTRTREYDFGQGAQGTLLRDTSRAYLGSQNNYCYTNLNGLDGTCGSGVYADATAAIHRRRLLLSETVKDGAGTVKDYTEYEYDNYANEGTGGNHAPLQSNSGMIQYDSLWFTPFAAASQPRGNVTAVKRLASGSPPPGSGTYLTSYSQYDEAGNVVKTKDPKGNSTSVSYADNFGDGSNPDTGMAGTNGATFALPTLVTNALGHQVKTQYVYARGVASGVKDANSIVTWTEQFDNYDRPLVVRAAYNQPEETRAEMSYPALGVNEAKASKRLDATHWLTSRTQLDGFGRPLFADQAEDGKHFTDSSVNYTIHTKTVYDGLGRAIKVTNPYRAAAASTDGWTRTSYDLAGRVIEVASFGGSYNTLPPDSGTAGTGYSGRVQTSYSGNQTTVTDQAGKQRRSIVDGMGRLAQVDELNTDGTPYASTTYTYDTLDNLVKVTQDNQVRYFMYDPLKRLIRARNPEQSVNTVLALTDAVTGNGQWSVGYAYDEDSNLTQKTDARNVVTTYGYDALNRAVSRSYTADPQSTPAVAYVYDNQSLPAGAPSYTRSNTVGRLVAVTYGGSSSGSYLSYDRLGRVSWSSQQTDGQNYTFSNYSYNQAGGLLSESYPSGRVVSQSYDAAGRVSQLSGSKDGAATTYAGAFSYTASGAVSSMGLSVTNNVAAMSEQTTFNARLQPTMIELRKAADNSVILGLDYGYGTSASQNNGNVASQAVRAGASTVATQSYTYDGQNRLLSVSETGLAGSWQQSYVYDRFGNRALNSTSSYQPNLRQTVVASSVSDLATKISATNNQIIASSEYRYDLAGNLDRQPTVTAQSGADQMVYDGENRQVSYTAGSATTSYGYDGDGRRVKRTNPDNTAVVFVYDAGGRLIAEYTTGAATGSGTSYVSQDALGSTRVVTRSDASVKARYDYLPFGEEVGADHRPSGLGYGGSDATRQKFTGKQRDVESGLDYFEARYFSAAQGRFTSPDEFTGGPDDLFDFADDASDNPTFYADLHEPQSLNKYQYAYNNPLRYVDPDGHGIWDKVKQAAETARQTILGATSAFLQDNGINVDSAGNSAGRFLGHATAIVQGVTEVVTGGTAAVGGSGEAIITSPATGTGVGAVIPAAGVVTAVAGAAVAVHGTAVLGHTAHNIFKKSGSSSQSASKNPTEMANELSQQSGKSSVTAQTPDKKVRIDLTGKSHFDKATGKRIPTPHVQTYKLNRGPGGKINTSNPTTRPATKADIRTARKLIGR